MSLKDAIRTAAQEQKRQSDQKKDDQNTGIPESGNAIIPAVAVPPDYTNLTVRVTKQQRLHWLIEAKKQGTSLTAAIVEALNARFGEPTDG